MKKKRERRQVAGTSSIADPSLNKTFCDGYLSQCRDSTVVSTCQKGGTDPSLNKTFCDGFLSQCRDSYVAPCQSGGDAIYRKYRKYKLKYKNLLKN